MRLDLLFKVLLLLTCCSFTSVVSAQNIAADSSNYTIAIQNAISAYHQYLSPQTSLYNGSEYVDYAYTINEGTPFFEDTQFSNGTVEYDNVWYSNVYIFYDEVLEEVVIKDAYNRGKIILNTEKVTGFSLLNHNFVKLAPDSTGKSPIRMGFYDVLYKGNLGVYKRQTKKILESISASLGLRRVIDEQNEYYIKKGTAFYAVNNKHDLLNITKDKKKEVQQFIRKNKLKIRQENDIALIKIATYYNQLTTN